ncbi:FitA-like ribbon-helix-helix domain-containing protein [Burkholderia gladioli]
MLSRSPQLGIFDPDLHRRLKVRAAEAGISIAELVRGLITRRARLSW